MSASKNTHKYQWCHIALAGVGMLLVFAAAFGNQQNINPAPTMPVSTLFGGQIPTNPQTQLLLIADSQQGDDPHGRDPHGEIHDKDLPSNKAEDKRKPTEDVYGGHELDVREIQKRSDDRFAADPR